jgi:spore germination protein YaaH
MELTIADMGVQRLALFNADAYKVSDAHKPEAIDVRDGYPVYFCVAIYDLNEFDFHLSILRRMITDVAATMISCSTSSGRELASLNAKKAKMSTSAAIFMPSPRVYL